MQLNINQKLELIDGYKSLRQKSATIEEYFKIKETNDPFFMPKLELNPLSNTDLKLIKFITNSKVF
jgi:hypothetical protein